MQQSENTVQLPNAVSMTDQRRRLWVNIGTALVECHVPAPAMVVEGIYIEDIFELVS